MKYFIITVDTEGDNLWEFQKGDIITTNNSIFLPRFQELCNKYAFKPVWLTNYEMASDQRFVKFAKKEQEEGNCEVGIHIHAWNNPPLYELNGKCYGNPYLIEYPKHVMREKFEVAYNLIKEKFGKAPVTHRAGRWIMNDDYFKLLEEYNIKVDCSYTPGVSWLNTEGETVTGGCDYRNVFDSSHYIGKVLEVPVTIRKTHFKKGGSWKSRLKGLVLGTNIWLRPAMSSLQDMMNLLCRVMEEPECDYVEFMIHSSELMAGGSPYFKTDESIEKLYDDMNNLFSKAVSLGYKGISLDEYYKLSKK